MSQRQKVTIRTLAGRKLENKPFSMLTCYDYSTALLMEDAGVESLLVGDTYGEVCLGFDSTLPVTVDHLVTVAAGVRRGAPSVYLIGDMPFLSYQVTAEDAIRNGGRFLAEAGCDCVKVEVDRKLLGHVEAMVSAGIPVMAHLGLRPQMVRSLGGYIAQGKEREQAIHIVEDALAMEEAGAVAVLLEAVPAELGRLVTETLSVPVVGCVSGPWCDGQVVVYQDMLGYSTSHRPPSVKTYANMHDDLVGAFRAYATDVENRGFPLVEKSITMTDVTLREVRGAIDSRAATNQE